MDRKFTIMVERDQDSGWYVASVSELQGCHTQAPDLPSLHENVEEAISLYLEVIDGEAEHGCRRPIISGGN